MSQSIPVIEVFMQSRKVSPTAEYFELVTHLFLWIPNLFYEVNMN